MPKFTRKEIEDLCKKYDLVFKNINQLSDDMYADYKLFIRGDGFFENSCWRRYLTQGAWNTIANFNTKDKQTFIVDSIGINLLHREYNDNDFFVVSEFCECNYTKTEFITWLDDFVKDIRIKMKKYLTKKKIKELEGDFK